MELQSWWSPSVLWWGCLSPMIASLSQTEAPSWNLSYDWSALGHLSAISTGLLNEDSAVATLANCTYTHDLNRFNSSWLYANIKSWPKTTWTWSSPSRNGPLIHMKIHIWLRFKQHFTFDHWRSVMVEFDFLNSLVKISLGWICAT